MAVRQEEEGFFQLASTFTKKWHHTTYPSISPLRPALSQAGKNILIAGGSTGIGLATAVAFAQASAATISILGRREAALQTAVKTIESARADPNSTRILYRVADVTDAESLRHAVASLAAEVDGGNLHVVVSNAGQINALGPVSTADADAVMRDFDVHVRGTLNVFQAFLPLAAPSGAVFISTSSGVSHSAPASGLGAYASSKAAGAKLVDYLGFENPGVRVHNVQPGVVETSLSETVTDRWDDDVSLPAHFFVWLASREAEFLRGKYLWVNFDVDEMVERAEEIEKSKLLTVLLDGFPV